MRKVDCGLLGFRRQCQLGRCVFVRKAVRRTVNFRKNATLVQPLHVHEHRPVEQAAFVKTQCQGGSCILTHTIPSRIRLLQKCNTRAVLSDLRKLARRRIGLCTDAMLTLPWRVYKNLPAACSAFVRIQPTCFPTEGISRRGKQLRQWRRRRRRAKCERLQIWWGAGTGWKEERLE